MLVREELTDFFQKALCGIALNTSELSLVEVESALLSKVRTKSINEKQRLAASRVFREKIEDDQILIIPLDSVVFSKARFLIEFCHPTLALRTLDAIHLAACDMTQRFPLCATDSRMRAAATHLHIPVFPETLPT